MSLPFVSRGRFDDAQRQIADLKEANFKLLELLGMKQATAQAAKPEDEPNPPRSSRKLGAQLRAEFREEAEQRAKQLGAKK